MTLTHLSLAVSVSSHVCSLFEKSLRLNLRHFLRRLLRRRKRKRFVVWRRRRFQLSLPDCKQYLAVHETVIFNLFPLTYSTIDATTVKRTVMKIAAYNFACEEKSFKCLILSGTLFDEQFSSKVKINQNLIVSIHAKKHFC